MKETLMISNGNIVLIDDSESSNIYPKIMIQEAGLDLTKVKEFTSSKGALEHLENVYHANDVANFPQLILIDINMPMISGWECVDKIREWNLGNNLPDIYMVSNSQHPMDLAKAQKNPIVKELREKFVDSDFFNSVMN